MASATYAPSDFTDATWQEIAKIYAELGSVELTAANVDDWLNQWSAFECAFSEASELASISYSLDTGDPDKRAAYLRFSSEIGPLADEERTRLARRLVGVGSNRVDLQTTLRRFRNAMDRFRPESVPLQQELMQLDSRYQQMTGTMSVEWQGERLPLTKLAPFVLDPNRDVRERAYRLSFAPYIESRNELADIFDAQIALRQQVASNAGSANYRDYAFRERNRFDYTAANCISFHTAVELHVTPAIERRFALRRTVMGITHLRPWDVDVDPQGRPALQPYRDIREFTEIAKTIFQRIDPSFGKSIGMMDDEELLDLDSRKGKRGGGFCSSLDHRKRPFIFMNAAGIHRDVETLIHEAGHAFHAIAAFESLPLFFQWQPDIEMAEFAAMSMELLALPYLRQEEGGFYSRQDARRAEVEQLERVLTSLAWIATVDAFQHWIYTNSEGVDRDARDAAWCVIFNRFAPWLDWTGLEDVQRIRWYRQLHIFLDPFYYIEYGIARLAAIQLWRNARLDQAAAVSAFRRALELGGTRSLPDLFAKAGIALTFDVHSIGSLVAVVEERLAELEGETG